MCDTEQVKMDLQLTYHVKIITSYVWILYIQPLKMEPIEGSETSANYNRTPGKYPKKYVQYLQVNSDIIVIIIFN